MLVALGLLAFGWEAVRVVFGDNFHVVIPGAVYRCAQPSPEFLAELVRDYGIRTVINLRGIGDGPLADWYGDEAKACQDLGISHENLTFSAYRVPHAGETRRLLEILDRSEKPVLLHCRRGADRTGLASAIALLSQTDTPYATARAHLGLRFGHWSYGAAGRLGEFFDDYETWLKDHKLQHDKTVFRRWLENDYVGGRCNAVIVSIEPLQDRPRPHTRLAYRIVYRNASREPWRFDSVGRSGIHLSSVVVDLERKTYKLQMGGMLERTVMPGETIELTAIVPPLEPGRHRLMFDLVEQGHTWFSQAGSVPWEEELIVRE
jgi:protein tyrosine phosphatase (PTP) superfamily phosphohydrolase (DUF442 family)